MAEQKESSVLFSLKELMNLEEDRIRKEDDERKRKEAAELQARQDAERRAREIEEERVRAEEERQRQEEQRVREERARVEAIHQAEIARTENEARLRAMQQQQAHEANLVALSQDKKKKKLMYVVYGISALLVLGAAGGGLAYRQNEITTADNERRHELELAQERAENEAKLAGLMNELQVQTDAITALQKDLVNAQNDADRKAYEAKIIEMQEQQKGTQTKINAARNNPAGSRATGTPRPACTCQAGDPLCACL